MPNVSEQEIRDYLLGGLTPEQHTELAAKIHNDAELQEELLAVEQELLDLYLAGSLTEDEQQYFLTHFLSSESGQRKLHFARLFRDYRDSHLQQESIVDDRVPAPITPIPVNGASPWFANSHRTPAYALSLVLVAGLLTTLVFWFYLRKTPTMHAPPAKIPALTLTAGATRSGGSMKELRVPARNDEVKVELELAKSDFKKYKTQLYRENQALVASQEELPIVSRNTHYVVPVTFTGNLLTPGEYQLKLSGVADSGQPEYIDSYVFRVTAEGAADADQDRNQLAR